MSPSTRAALLALVCAAAGGCRRGASPPPLPPPEAALEALAQVGGDGARLFDLLDQQSRWSVMTVHRDLRHLCELVRAHYPKDRQARELARCHAAEAAPEPRDFFGRQANAWGVLRGLQGLTGKEGLEGSGEQRTVKGLRPPVILCRGPDWSYCGLREELERIKLRTTRDLATVQENVEAYRGR
jgi:hypothetical protein